MKQFNATPSLINCKTNLVVLYSQNYAAGIHGRYHESSDCFEYPKKSLLKSSHPPPPKKNACQISLPENIPESKISNSKKSWKKSGISLEFCIQKSVRTLILRSSPALEIRSSPPGPKININKTKMFTIFIT